MEPEASMFTRPYLEPDESRSHRFFNFHSILSFHPCISQGWSFAFSCFVTKILYVFLFPPTRYIPCQSHDPQLITGISGEANKLWSSSLQNFLHPPVTATLLGPDILSSTLLSNFLTLHSFLRIRNQVQTHTFTAIPHIWCLSPSTSWGHCTVATTSKNFNQ
jgi:hypothetical protein